MQACIFEIVLHALIFLIPCVDTYWLQVISCLSGGVLQTHSLSHEKKWAFAHYSVGHLTMQLFCFSGGTHKNLYFQIYLLLWKSRLLCILCIKEILFTEESFLFV